MVLKLSFLDALRIEANAGIFMPEAAQRSMQKYHRQLKEKGMVLFFTHCRSLQRTDEFQRFNHAGSGTKKHERYSSRHRMYSKHPMSK